MYEKGDYHHIKHQIAPGDVIAFGGNSLFSRIAKTSTRSVVSHIAIVVDSTQTASETPLNVALVEAYYSKRNRGICITTLEERLPQYAGNVWWLPLSQQAKQQMAQHSHSYHQFIHQQIGKPYDIWQLFGAAFDLFDNVPVLHRLTYNRKNTKRWFCSELIAQSLTHAGIITHLNPSETTPKDICQFNIFAQRYMQIKGETAKIEGFNTRCPEGWGIAKNNRSLIPWKKTPNTRNPS